MTTNSLNEEPRNYASTSVMHSNSNCESLEEVSDVEFRNLEVLSAENGNSNTLTVTNSGDECDAVVKNMEYNDFDLNEWYLLDVDKNGSCAMLRSESAESEENIVFEIPLDISKKISDKVVNVTDKVLNSISDILPFKRKTEEEKRPTDVLEKKGIGAIFSKTVSNDCKDLKTLLKEFKNFTTDSDYYVSPYLAPDAVIQLLPPVHFMVRPTLKVINLYRNLFSHFYFPSVVYLTPV